MGRRGQGGGGLRLKGRATVFAESEHEGRGAGEEGVSQDSTVCVRSSCEAGVWLTGQRQTAGETGLGRGSEVWVPCLTCESPGISR